MTTEDMSASVSDGVRKRRISLMCMSASGNNGGRKRRILFMCMSASASDGVLKAHNITHVYALEACITQASKLFYRRKP